jgi:hypothetical protein
MVSVLMIGVKLSAAKEVAQTWQRRIELKANLRLLQPVLEAEDLASWLDDAAHDMGQRQQRIATMEKESASDLDAIASEAIEKGLRMLARSESSAAAQAEHISRQGSNLQGSLRSLAKQASTTWSQLHLSATITRVETKQDSVTGLLLGQAEAEIRCMPQEILAYILNADGRHVQVTSRADRNMVRQESLETVNSHQQVIFFRYRLPGVPSDRTFLNHFVARRFDDATFVLACVPIARHDKITQKDEAGAVRAENTRIFRLSEVTPGVTRLEYICCVDLKLNGKGFIPQIVANRVAIPAQLKVPQHLQIYFQQLRPLSECTADDGRVVGQMLTELDDGKPEETARAIRSFADRTAMLRECGFRHIGDMLAALVTTPAVAWGASEDMLTLTAAKDPAWVTLEQATAIGAMLAMKMRSTHVPASALPKAVDSQAALCRIKAQHAWFVPMLGTLIAAESRVRGSTVTSLWRLSARVKPKGNVENFLGVMSTES